jgi:hypothetical protein
MVKLFFFFLFQKKKRLLLTSSLGDLVDLGLSLLMTRKQWKKQLRK